MNVVDECLHSISHKKSPFLTRPFLGPMLGLAAKLRWMNFNGQVALNFSRIDGETYGPQESMLIISFPQF
jgi:hypothetical protein